MGPADGSEDAELLDHEVGHVPEGQPVGLRLCNEVLLRGFCDLGVLLRVQHLQVTVQNEEAHRDRDQQQREEEVLDQECDEFAAADTFFLDEEVKLAGALLAVDALVEDDLRRLAVGVHAFAGALARLAKLGRHLQVLQVGLLTL